MAFSGTYDNSFRPQINKHSQQLGIAPLQDRAQQVMHEQYLKKAQLLNEAEEEFNARSTFAPVIDRVSEKMTENRVPLRDRTNYPKDLQPVIDPEATHAPKINATSKKLLSSHGAREAQATSFEAKRKVKELWTRHCGDGNGGGAMIWSEVQRCLKDLKIDPDGDISRKFYLALGFDGPHANKYIEFPRFSSIFTSVIQSAAASASVPKSDHDSHSQETQHRQVLISESTKTPQQQQQRMSTNSFYATSMDGQDEEDESQIHTDPEAPQPHRQPPVPQHRTHSATAVRRESGVAKQPADSVEPASSYYARRRDANNGSSSTQPSQPSVAAPQQHVDPMQQESRDGGGGGGGVRGVSTCRASAVASLAPRGGKVDPSPPVGSSSSGLSVNSPVSDSSVTPHRRLTTVIPKRQVASKYAMGATSVAQPKKRAPPLSHEEQQVAACTFGPKINKHMVARPHVRPTQPKPPVQSSADLEAAKCSFQPRTNGSVPPSSSYHQRLPKQGSANKLTKQQSRLSEEADPYGAILSPSTTMTNNDFVSQQQQPRGRSVEKSSFSPGGGDSTVLPLGSNSYLKNCPGFDKSIQRMALARENHKPKFEESLRGEGGNHNQDHDSVHRQRQSEQPRHCETKVQPFHLRSEKRQEEREKEKPMLFVDVDISASKSGRIGVHRGDKPEELAKNFAKTYGIDFAMEQRLGDMLREKIRHTLESESIRTLDL